MEFFSLNLLQLKIYLTNERVKSLLVLWNLVYWECRDKELIGGSFKSNKQSPIIVKVAGKHVDISITENALQMGEIGKTDDRWGIYAGEESSKFSCMKNLV